MKTDIYGKVYLVGAGPGDPDLLTVKALRVLQTADVVVYDRLVSPEIMKLLPKGARLIDVGKKAGDHRLPQHRINELLVELAVTGAKVVRLKGGDPLIFGRVGEEAAELAQAGVRYEIIPGITSAQGAAASAGIPLTQRGVANSIRYITGHREKDASLDLDWAGLASPDTTLVIYMGAMNIDEISSNLIAHGLPADTPAMVVSSATTTHERREVATLGTLAKEIEAAQLPSPVLIIIGQVVDLYEHSRGAQQVYAYA